MTMNSESRTRKKILLRPDKTKWKAVMQDEYVSLLKNKTWRVVDRSKDQHVLFNRWVFRRKIEADENIQKYKARFVVRDFEQIHEVDFDEIFVFVVKQLSYKILFVIQAMFEWKCHQMNVKTAFLHDKIEKEIYVESSDEFSELKNKVLMLVKTLYDLKQTLRRWYLKLKDFLVFKEWKASSFDTSVFIHLTGLILIVYVDDINILDSRENQIIVFKKVLATEFEMIDLEECVYYLSLHVSKKSEEIYLHQADFVQQILNRFALNDIKSVSTSTTSNSKLAINKTEIATQDFTRLYQAMIESVNYLSIVSRPDIIFATDRIARYMSNSTENHMKEVHRLYAYLKESMHLGLFYKMHFKKTIQEMIDSDWDNCSDIFRSTGGWIFKLADSSVSWSSKR